MRKLVFIFIVIFIFFTMFSPSLGVSTSIKVASEGPGNTSDKVNKENYVYLKEYFEMKFYEFKEFYNSKLTGVREYYDMRFIEIIKFYEARFKAGERALEISKEELGRRFVLLEVFSRKAESFDQSIANIKSRLDRLDSNFGQLGDYNKEMGDLKLQIARLQERVERSGMDQATYIAWAIGFLAIILSGYSAYIARKASSYNSKNSGVD